MSVSVYLWGTQPTYTHIAIETKGTYISFSSDKKQDENRGEPQEIIKLSLKAEEIKEAYRTFDAKACGALGWGIWQKPYDRTAYGVAAYFLEKGGLFETLPPEKSTPQDRILQVYAFLGAITAIANIFAYFKMSKAQKLSIVFQGFFDSTLKHLNQHMFNVQQLSKIILSEKFRSKFSDMTKAVQEAKPLELSPTVPDIVGSLETSKALVRSVVKESLGLATLSLLVLYYKKRFLSRKYDIYNLSSLVKLIKMSFAKL